MKTQDYAAAVASRPKPDISSEDLLVDVPIADGIVWKMKPIPFRQFIISGRLPLSVFSKLPKGQRTKEAAEQNVSVDEGVLVLEFVRDALLDFVVEPKFVEYGSGEDGFPVEDIPPEHFDKFQEFVMKGGGAETASTFSKRDRGAGPRGGKQRAT